MISVCVPTYNGEAYLAECLDSVLAQTFPDFEVLVVDDCSGDGTVAMAEGYARRDPRVRVVRNERNLGLVGNWNRCVELAAGEWVKFVFQDDTVAPTCLERMLAAGGDGVLMISCARDFVFAPGTREKDREDYLWHQRKIDSLLSESMTAEAFGDLAIDYTDVNLLGEPTVVMLHRSVFPRFGPFNELMAQVVDSEYWARVGSAVGARHIRDTLASFRVHAASTSRFNNTQRVARVRLDPLLIRHDFAFSPAYEPLRAMCRARRPDRDLEREFWDAAYVALVEDGLAATLARADDRTRAETERVYAAYPRLRRIPPWYGIRRAIAGYLSDHQNAARVWRLAKRTALGSARLLGAGR